MGRGAVEHYLWLLNVAFEASEFGHSLIGNLEAVDDAIWREVPPGGGRSIADIVGHVGECKYVYENHAFGDRLYVFGRPPAQAPEGRLECLEWLGEGHRRFVASVAALDDAELLRPRHANWGTPYETRALIATMIEHDNYHAGEINHIRSLLQGTDRWPWANE